MTEKEFTDLKELINTHAFLIKEFKLFLISYLNTAFALSKTIDNQIENTKPHLKQSLQKKAEVSTVVILKAACTITTNTN